jgi:spore coat protein U-like protein
MKTTTAMRHLAMLLATGGLMLPAQPAEALCLLCVCSVSTPPLAFGTYDQTSATAKDANITMTITCSGVATLFTADVSMSTGGSGSATARRMASGSNLLYYNIYSDSNHSIVWGDGTGGAPIVQVPIGGLLGATATATAYGRIPALQNVAVGSYTDTVTITVIL